MSAKHTSHPDTTQCMRHTSGPWRACKDGDCKCGQVFGEGDKHIATVHDSTMDSDGTTYAEWPAEERKANAKLISAAPELLEALEEWLSAQDAYDEWMVLPVREDWTSGEAKSRGERLEAARTRARAALAAYWERNK